MLLRTFSFQCHDVWDIAATNPAGRGPASPRGPTWDTHPPPPGVAFGRAPGRDQQGGEGRLGKGQAGLLLLQPIKRAASCTAQLTSCRQCQRPPQSTGAGGQEGASCGHGESGRMSVEPSTWTAALRAQPTVSLLPPGRGWASRGPARNRPQGWVGWDVCAEPGLCRATTRQPQFPLSSDSLLATRKCTDALAPPPGCQMVSGGQGPGEPGNWNYLVLPATRNVLGSG